MERVQRVESIKDMDQKELEEELPRLREEAVKAEEALRVAQQRLHEADHRMAKIPTFVEVHEDRLQRLAVKLAHQTLCGRIEVTRQTRLLRQ